MSSLQLSNAVQSLDVALPANLDAERMILGVVLLDNSVVMEAVSSLSPDDFFSPRHRTVFEAYRVMCGRTEIDPLTLQEQLNRAHSGHNCDAAFIAGLFDGVPRFSNITRYIEIVREKSLLRQAMRMANWIMGAAADPSVDVGEFLARIEREVGDLRAAQTVDDLVTSEEAINRTLVMLEEQWESGNTLLGMPTGIHALDHRLCGIRRGKYITIAGTPGMGKTTLALNFANHFDLSAPADRKPVGLIITLEMTVEELKVKLISARTGISTTRIETGHMSNDERRAVRQAAAALADLTVEYIEGFSRVTAASVRARVDKVFRKHGGRIDYLILDYIQLVDTDDDSGKETENAKLTEISRTLKRIANRYNIPVLVLSQLNRQWASRANKDPELTDIRGSGSIVQDSDIVIFICPNDQADPEGPVRKLLTRKFRGGQTGTDLVLFSGRQSRFMNIEDQPIPARPAQREFTEDPEQEND